MVLSALLLLTTASPDLGFRIASAQEELAATLEQKRRWHRETLSLQCKLATYKPPVAKTTASAELEAAAAAHVCDASASQQLPSEPPAEVGHADDHHGTGAAISGARLVRLEAKVAAAREQYLRWRKQAGLLHCELAERRGDKRPAGPHGGFCPTVAAKAGGAKTFTSNHNCIARGFAGWLARLFANKRVLDVGCGGGHYGRHFRERRSKDGRRGGYNISWLGLDGAEGVEAATRGAVAFADLTFAMPPVARQPWDWVMSIEVGEHIPRALEANYVHGVVSSAGASAEGILLSWGVLNQWGSQHINCHSVEYVVCAMGLMGWTPDLSFAREFRSCSPPWLPCSWLQYSTMIYRRADAAPTPPAAAAAAAAAAPVDSLLPLPSFATKDFVAKYDRLTRARCFTPREDIGCGVHPKLRNVTRVDCGRHAVNAYAGNVCTKSRYDKLEDGSNARCSAGAAERVLAAWQPSPRAQ